MISATVIGNLGRDADLRRGGDSDVLSFTVASRRYERGTEATDWVTVSLWGKRATSLLPHLKKGARVAVRGALHVREYEHNGEKRFSTELRADDVELLGSNERRGDATQASDFGGGHDSSIPF